MANNVTLEQIEQLAVQLPPQEQLRMVAYISQRLSKQVVSETVEEHERREYARKVEAFLRMSDEMAAEMIGEVDLTEDIRQIREERADALLAELDTIAESIEGEFDSAEDIRQIREERTNRL